MDRRGGVDTLHLCRGIYPIIREEAKIESGKRGHVGYARRDACALCPLCKWDKPSERSFRIGREERWRGRRTTRSRGAGRGQMVARGWTKGPGIHQSKKGATFAGLGQPSGRPRPRIFSRIAARGWSCFGLRTSPSSVPYVAYGVLEGPPRVQGISSRPAPRRPVLLLLLQRVVGKTSFYECTVLHDEYVYWEWIGCSRGSPRGGRRDWWREE